MLLPVMMAGLPDLLDDVAAALHELDPSYAEFLVSGREEVLAAAQLAVQNLVEGAVESLAWHEPGASPATVPAGEDVAWALFEQVGRDLWRRELPLRTLLSAYQLGGRVGWRRISGLAVQRALPADALAALAEAVFRLLDQVGAATTAGYVEEQAQSVIAREQLRDALVEHLLSDRSGSASVEQAARSAGWPLPAEAAVVLLSPDDEPGREALTRLPPHFLPLRHTLLPGAIIPDPAEPGRHQRLANALRGTTALVGPTVALADLPESARLTEAAAQTLDHRGAEESPVFVVEHLDALIVHRDRRLFSAMQEHCLRPLQDAAPASRDALRETLRSWLVQMGSRRAVAEELGIHPQTVRYRLSRLQELFGPALEDPRARLRLLLALGWENAEGTPMSRPERALRVAAEHRHPPDAGRGGHSGAPSRGVPSAGDPVKRTAGFQGRPS